MLILTAVSLTIGLSIINISQYFNDKKDEYKTNAINAAVFAASVVDPSKVDIYLANGLRGFMARNLSIKSFRMDILLFIVG